MRKILCLIFLLSTVIVLAPVLPDEYLDKQRTLNQEWLIKEKIRKAKEYELAFFLLMLSYDESSVNPNNYNDQGYIGLYAIGESARELTEYGHITFNEFKEKGILVWPRSEQKKSVLKLIKKNQQKLAQIIEQYDSTYVKRKGKLHFITKSGILAAAHLSGTKNVKRYFATKGEENPHDRNKTSLEKYLIKFSGYNF